MQWNGIKVFSGEIICNKHRECDEEVPDGGAITSFFSNGTENTLYEEFVIKFFDAGGVAKRKRCDYYTRRKMTRIAPADFTLGKGLN